jgi:hypothetical protein
MTPEDLKSVALLCAILVIAVLGAMAFGDEVASRSLYDAIRQVESGGDDFAVGAAGEKGPLQCGRAAWKDACEYGKLDWDYDTHVWDIARVEYISHLYWKRHGATTDEARCRVWNGGPNGMRKKSTLSYWRKVQKLL